MENNIDLVKKLLELPWYNLILISILIIPLFIASWTTLITSLNVNLSDQQKKIVVLVFIVLYSLGLTIGKIGHDKEDDKKWSGMAQKIETDILTSNPTYKVLSYGKLKFKNPTFSNDDINNVAKRFPTKFSIVSIGDATDLSKQDASDPVGLYLLPK